MDKQKLWTNSYRQGQRQVKRAVDHKEGRGRDPFDDLSIPSDSIFTRRQIKSSENAGLVFALQHLNAVRSNLQIDDLVRLSAFGGNAFPNLTQRSLACW
jgi:hypothetical protein